MSIYLVRRVIKKAIVFIGVFLISFLILQLLFIVLQKYIAHKNAPFVPDYEKVVLTESTDYETIFLQTGLGKSAVDKLMSEGDFKAILKAQDIFFTEPETECVPMFGWFTREDRLGDSDSIPFADLQTGDVIVTLSTHSLGWRHGHAGFVIDENKVLECQRIGTKTSIEEIYYWSNYTNYAVLRIKDVSSELQNQALNTANKINGTPYYIFSGIFGSKKPNPDSKNFGFYCTNLVWYIWKQYGFDIDSDGGRIVTGYDILHSNELEVVQIFGMDPRDFL